MSAAEKTAVTTTTHSPSLIAKFAAKFGVEPNKMLGTLKATAFRGEVSNEQMMALLIVADQYGLNPWTKEIYAFPDKNNGIVPVIGLDGWSRIINSNSNFDGMEFELAGEGQDLAMTCTIWRRDREHPISVTEYMAECKRPTQPWSSHPRRMLRHKAMIQCARVAFGYVGIFDEDEAERIIDAQSHTLIEDSPKIASINERIKGATIEHEAVIAPTPAEISDMIKKAANADAVDAALALMPAEFDEETKKQIRADADHRKTELA